MGLNIKNERTNQLIKELASLTGENQTAAVEEAVRERLERLKRPKHNPEQYVRRVKEITADLASRIKEPWKSIDHGDFLYGEDGLPK